jgi:homoserine kinase
VRSVATPDGSLTASFSIHRSSSAPKVELAGTLSGGNHSAEEELLVIGFDEAFRRAGRRVPAGLRVRASSNLPRGDELFASAALASIGAANAMYGLGLNDADVASFAASLVHGSATAAETVGGLSLRVTLRQDCDDDMSVSDPERRAETATTVSIGE